MTTLKNNHSFYSELADCWLFIKNPRFIPNNSNKMDFVYSPILDFLPKIYFKKLFLWAIFLWTINLLIFSPITMLIVNKTGVQHKLDISNIPWLTAILWAPIIEEMLFRYILCRPDQIIYLFPFLIPIFLLGPKPISIIILGIILIGIFYPFGQPKHYKKTFYWNTYSNFFPWIFHIVALLFANIHLFNFVLNEITFITLPLLTLPQWITGLVLGWIRIKFGIGSSIVLHAIFNIGPILIISLIINMYVLF